MISWLYLAAACAALAAIAYAAARSMACNLRRLRTARRAEPLAGLDLTGAAVIPVPVPANWPEVDELAVPAEAAAYAALADDRALLHAVWGTLLEIVGAAALGVGLPLLTRGRHAVWPIVGGLLVAVLGLALRTHGAREWEPVAARYRARYAELLERPPPARMPPEMLNRFLGRPSRRTRRSR